MINRMIAAILPFLPKRVVWVFSKKYIAGPSAGEAVKVVQLLNACNLLTTIDILGESIKSKEQAGAYQKQYLDMMDTAFGLNLKTSFSLKPSMFGLLWDYNYCLSQVRQIVEKASILGFFVRIDMEDSRCTQLELNLFETLYSEFGNHIGIVLQACLKRTIHDLNYLQGISTKEHPVNIRLCKGIYNELPAIAFKSKTDIRSNFLKCLDFIITHGLYPAIATHDKELVKQSFELLDKYKKTAREFELQMLFGVTPQFRRQLVERGYSLRVYVPFGEQWLRYSTRRLQENPRMVWDILRAIIVKS
jgi:proline dehydrogenase